MLIMPLIRSLFILFLFTGCYNVERNCADFKTGTFEFEAVSGTEVFTTRIIRNDSIEIEYFKESVDTASIRWINDCEYILKKLKPKNRAEQKAIHIKILTTTKNQYTFEFNEVGKSAKSKATARRLSDK
jgi:hypothetical protein